MIALHMQPHPGKHNTAFLKSLLLYLFATCFLGSGVSCFAQESDSDFAIQAMLAKNAITAVNHANLTGNYTVLRDLGTVEFREKNSAAELAIVFKSFRDRKLDLSPILVMAPKFNSFPKVDSSGVLLLEGTFSTKPQPIIFCITYRQNQEGWMLDHISLKLETPPARFVPILPSEPVAGDSKPETLSSR